MRIAFYSHDAMGLGHMRRNLLLADLMAGLPGCSRVLLIAGAPELTSFSIPRGVDPVILPALRKQSDGSYLSRDPGIHVRDLLARRSQILLAALRSFAPDLLIVDKHPQGILGELTPSISMLRHRNSTRMILGLRDILDAPEAVRHEWSSGHFDAVIQENYDAVWVYGDRDVYDVALEYGLLPQVAEKIRYTGYLDPTARIQAEQRCAPATWHHLPPGKLALCLVGGGQDGESVALAFADRALPPDASGVIVTGPFMPSSVQQGLRRQAEQQDRLRVLGFTTALGALLDRADRIVAMGGYNTTCEALSSGKPVLIAPRARPRSEQLIRAQRLSALSLLEVLPPHEVSASNIRRWLSGPAPPPVSARRRIDFNGLTRIPQLLDEVMTQAPLPGLWGAA